MTAIFEVLRATDLQETNMNAAEKKAAARKVRCPRCNAQPNFSCKRYTKTKLIFLKAPHAERISAAS